MKYFIELSSSIIELETRVNKQMTNGWRPQGGITVVKQEDNTNLYYQAMTKEDK